MKVLAIDVPEKIESEIEKNLDSIFYHSARRGTKSNNGKNKPDLVLIGLHRDREAEHCRAMREKYESVPVISITDSDRPSDRIAALNAGADECVSRKLLNFEILKAKIKAIRRGYQK